MMSTTPVRALAALLLTACTAGTTVPYVPPDADQACAALGGDFVAASTSNLIFSTLIVNQFAVVPDIAQARGCVQAEPPGAAWVFGAEGGEYGALIVTAPVEGPQQLPTDFLVVDLYGAEPPIRFDGVDFGTGNFVVNSLSPYAVSLQDASAATPGGDTISIAFTATAAL